MSEDDKTFTQADLDKALEEQNAKHQEEMNNLAGKLRAEFKAKEQKAKEDAEKAAKEANMSELEKAQSRIKDLETQYAEKENIIALAKQKDETRTFLKEIGVDEANLDYVFVEKDMEATKTKAQAFKEMIDGVKKQTFEGSVDTTIPGAGKDGQKDAFLEGFDTGSIK